MLSVTPIRLTTTRRPPARPPKPLALLLRLRSIIIVAPRMPLHQSTWAGRPQKRSTRPKHSSRMSAAARFSVCMTLGLAIPLPSLHDTHSNGSRQPHFCIFIAPVSDTAVSPCRRLVVCRSLYRSLAAVACSRIECTLLPRAASAISGLDSTTPKSDDPPETSAFPIAVCCSRVLALQGTPPAGPAIGCIFSKSANGSNASTQPQLSQRWLPAPTAPPPSPSLTMSCRRGGSNGHPSSQARIKGLVSRIGSGAQPLRGLRGRFS